VTIKVKKNPKPPPPKQTKKKQTGNKKHDKRKKCAKIHSIHKLIEIPLTNDIKKHIWIQIFMDLLFSFYFSVMAFCLFFIQLLYMFLFFSILLELLLVLQNIWLTVIASHIGNIACAKQNESMNITCISVPPL
jgi:hypothetical protein